MRGHAFYPRVERCESRVALSGADMIDTDNPDATDASTGADDEYPLPGVSAPATGPLPMRSGGPMGGILSPGSDPDPQLNRDDPAFIDLGLIGIPECLPDTETIDIPPPAPTILPPDNNTGNTGSIS